MQHPTEVDKYQIIKPIGRGQFGQVYHAFDRALSAEKAIKILEVTDPSQYLDALKEAHILNLCRHKHIVAINEANIFPVNGVPRLVLDLEFIAEGSLQAALEDHWISIRAAVSYIRGALMGLEFAHSQGFLHRDIKPANVLLAPTAAKLSDFGLATKHHPGTQGSGQGYITHLPPEFFVSNATSQSTDIFATGVTLYRVVSNICDWHARLQSLTNVDQLICKGAVIQKLGFEPYIPRQIRRIVRAACSPEVTNRYSSASAFRQQLDSLRFSIEWVREPGGGWRGSSEKQSHEAFIDPKHNELVVKKNDRRVNESCNRYHSISCAELALSEHIAESSIVT